LSPVEIAPDPATNSNGGKTKTIRDDRSYEVQGQIAELATAWESSQSIYG
jgi:hypothetical protein